MKKKKSQKNLKTERNCSDGALGIVGKKFSKISQNLKFSRIACFRVLESKKPNSGKILENFFSLYPVPRRKAVFCTSAEKVQL